MPHSQNSSQDRRQAIRKAARALFDAHGYTNTTVDAVAAEAGIAKGSVYNYFESKQALFMDVVFESFAAQDAATDELAAADLSATRKIAGIFDVWLAGVPELRKIGGLVLEFYAAAARGEPSRQAKALFDDICAKHRRIIADIVRDGMATGEFHTENEPENAALLIMAVLDGLMLRAVLDDEFGADVPADIVDSLQDAVVTALRHTSRPFHRPPSPAGSSADSRQEQRP